MPNTIAHGWIILLLGYGLTVTGLLSGLRFSRALSGRLLWAFGMGTPVFLAGILFWNIIVNTIAPSLFRLLPQIFSAVLGATFYATFGALVSIVVCGGRPRRVHARGAVIIDGANRGVVQSSSGQELTIAGQSLSSLDETKHFKMVGTTGTGKSTAIRELLAGALDRGDRAVIADPDGGYIDLFYKPKRGDVILNPFDSVASRWDLFAEIEKPHEADQLALALIPDNDGSDRNWSGYAWTFLTAVLRQLQRAEEHDVARLYRLLLLTPASELQDLLESTAAAPFLARDNEKLFESVRSVGGSYIAPLEHVARQSAGTFVSVRQWVRSGTGVLLFPYRASEIATLRSIISTWMRIAILETMTGKEEDHRLWFLIDELDALGTIEGLKDAQARLRKFGGRCVLGFQSIAQVPVTYGDATAQSVVENCGSALILRCSAREHGGTAEFASRLIGKREVMLPQVSLSRPQLIFGSLRETKTTPEHYQTEDAVTASEIEQLPDLTEFIKLASRPEWRRVMLSRKSR